MRSTPMGPPWRRGGRRWPRGMGAGRTEGRRRATEKSRIWGAAGWERRTSGSWPVALKGASLHRVGESRRALAWRGQRRAPISEESPAPALNAGVGGRLRASPERRARAVHQQVKTLWVPRGLDGPLGAARGHVSERTEGSREAPPRVQESGAGDMSFDGPETIGTAARGSRNLPSGATEGSTSPLSAAWPLSALAAAPVHHSVTPCARRGLRQFRGLPPPRNRAFTSRSLAFTTGSPAVTTGSPPPTGPPPAFTTGSPLGRFSPAEGPQTGSGGSKRGQLRPRFAEPKTGRLRAPQEKRGVVSPRAKRRSVHRLRPKFVRGQLWLPKTASAQT
jgi:hypothetical protein